MLYTRRMSDDCVFCKIVRGELPSYKIYETDAVVAFLDIRPVNAGHTLVVPKQHSHNIFDIAPEDWASVAEGARLVAIAIEKGLGADGVNIAMNNREHAGQVVDHPHIHVIPRFKGDGLKLMPQRSYLDGEAESSAEKIRGALT
jgi:histidine triad (HIT) family protein